MTIQMDRLRFRVLVVDDDEEDYIIARDLLSRVGNGGFEVDWAGSFEAALELMSTIEHDAYLVDYRLGPQSGLDLLSEARRLGCSAPIIMLTGHPEREVDLAAMKAGATDFLAKDQMSEVLLERAIRYAIERRRAADALRESEERYRLVAETATDAIITIDEDDRITFANPAVDRIFGYAPHEMIGLRLTALMPEHLRVPHLKALERYLLNGRHHRNWEAIETVGLHKDGREIPLEVSFGEFFRQGKRSFTGILRDISERKRAEQALRESEASLKRTEEFSLVMVTHVSLNGRWLKVPPTLSELLGYSEAELLGSHFGDVTHPEDFEADWSQCQRLLRGEIKSFDLEKRYIRRDGKMVWVYMNRSIVTDEDGTPVHLLTYIRDITKRKQAEEALRRAEERFRSLFENAIYGIYLSTPEGKFLDVNPALVAMLGYDSAGELKKVNTEAGIYVDPTQRPALVARLEAEGEISGVEVEWKQKPGSQIVVRLSGRVVLNHAGERECFEMIVEDVTAQRLLEQQLRQSQKMEAIGRLAGGIAHDFNNLLTAILGYSQLALSRLDGGQPPRLEVEEIIKAGTRAAALTGQLLAFSRKQVLQPRVLDLNSVISDSTRLLRRVIGEDIELEVVLDPALGKIKADPNQIDQVIMNLAVNARDAMPRGGKLTIETSNVELDAEYVRCHVDVRPGPYVVLAVSDTGTGMDQATLARVFEPFFTTKETGKGTGLGLSTVYGIVKQSGGSIWAYSEPGHGTTFKVYLPRIDGGAQPTAEEVSQAEIPRGSETVLVVEDEPVVRSLTCDVLRACGYTVLEASRGEEALIELSRQSGTVHLMITDVVMPGMGGAELAERVRALRPETRVLFISGYADTAMAGRGLLESGAAYLQKPFTPRDIARKVRDVLGK